MYGVPEDMDLTMLHGATLDSIHMSLGNLGFHFSREAVHQPKARSLLRVKTHRGTAVIPNQAHSTISVQSRWELEDSTGRIVDEALPDDTRLSEREAYRVHVLLSREVTATSIDPPRSITLAFEGGYTLRIYDDSPQHESFQVELGEGGGYIV